MHPIFRHFAILALTLTSACSTVVEGSTQKITVDSSPQGAQCLIQQAGDIVGRVTTPGTAEIEKSKNDLVISCSKDGYESVSLKNRSDLAVTSFGNMAFYQLSFLGSAVDSVTGASNKYDSKVFVNLTPASAPAAFPAPPGLPVAAQLPVQSVTLMSMQVPMPGMLAAPEPVVLAPPAVSTPTVAAAAASIPAALSESDPAIHASVRMAQAAVAAAERPQVAQLSYTQVMAESTRRPPFE